MNTRLPERRKGFVVVGAGKPLILQVLIALHAFSDARCLVVCLRGTRLLRWSALVADYIETDFGEADADAVIGKIRRFSDMVGDALLIPADCEGSRWINRMRERLPIPSIPTPDAAMLDCFDDKWNFHRFCVEQGFNTPATLFFRDKHELDFGELKAALGSPFVVKPARDQASRGVCVLSSEEDYLVHVRQNPAYRHAPLIAQRHVEGIDVGLNILAWHGKVLAMSIQRRMEPGHDGSRIQFFRNSYLEKVGVATAKASRYHGVMNIDARIEKDTGKVYLFESNPRFWRSHSASTWCGMNFVEHSVMAPRDRQMKTLFYGSADTYYHPLFRPALWPHFLFSRNSHGRQVRIVASDVCSLLLSAKILFARAKHHTKKSFLAVCSGMKGEPYERARSH